MPRTPAPLPNEDAPFARRKGPQQKRAKLTVDSIMSAALELIGRDGFHTLTTTRIAERAGVGVGSLYEYFPNREAILLALYEDASAKAAAQGRELIASILDLPLEKALPKAMRGLIRIYSDHRLVLLEMATEMPELKLSTHPISYDKLVQSAVSAYLQHIGLTLPPRAMQRRLHFINQLIVGAIRQYVRDWPAHTTKTELIADLSQVVIAYLSELAPSNKTTRNPR